MAEVAVMAVEASSALEAGSTEMASTMAGVVLGGHHAERTMNSNGRQSRFSRSQLLHTGFFSSHDAWRALQV